MLGHKVLVVAGPTASGKSGLALDIACERNGVILNADASQLYRELRVLTARPSPQDEAKTDHRMYGIFPVEETCTAAKWARLVAEEIRGFWAAGRLPIVVGGTGLYIGALMKGLSPIPDIPEEVRMRVREQFKELGNQAFHRFLAERDAAMGKRLKEGDTQRLVRAMEVIEHTGKSLDYWQGVERVKLLPEAEFEVRLLTEGSGFTRAELYTRIEARFDAMMGAGAVEEVKALIDQKKDRNLPALQAVGVQELWDYLEGALTREEAVSQAKQASRNYAKRQMTWFRHQM